MRPGGYFLPSAHVQCCTALKNHNDGLKLPRDSTWIDIFIDRKFKTLSDTIIAVPTCYLYIPYSVRKIVRQESFADMTFSLYSWLDSYCESIIHEIIIATLCAYMCTSHLASIYKNFNPQIISLIHCNGTSTNTFNCDNFPSYGTQKIRCSDFIPSRLIFYPWLDLPWIHPSPPPQACRKQI